MSLSAAAPITVERWPSERPLFVLALLVSIGVWALAVVSIIGLVYAVLFGLFFAAMHVAFWESPWATETGRGSTTSWRLYTAFAPETGRREAEHPNEVVAEIRLGWERFWALAEPDVADLV